MKMRRSTLMQLARRRSADMGQLQDCVTHDYGDGLVEVDTEHAAYPRARPGLGDMVAAGLSAVGVTKERVSAAIGRPCSCPERQAALNRIGHKYLGLPTGIRG